MQGSTIPQQASERASRRRRRKLRIMAAFGGCVLLTVLALRLQARPEAAAPAPAHPSSPSVEALRAGFRSPPDDCRIMMRWWWFGPAVVKPELAREMEAMRAAGIGGFEVQPVYPLTLDDPQKGLVNLPYLSAPFLDDLHFAAQTAARLGLRFDLTLASGWPYGGPSVPVTQASSALRVVRTAAPAGSTSVPAPALEPGEKLLAAFLENPSVENPGAGPGLWRQIQPLPGPDLRAGRFPLPQASAEQQTVVFFLASRTGMMVKRPSVGAEGFVVDHLDRAAIAAYLEHVADPLLRGVQSSRPYAVFSDSLEVYGADWTPDLPAEFEKLRGYDLIPHLPALLEDTGPDAPEIRYDWARTLTELLDRNYFAQIQSWAHAHGVRLRAQAYGPPATILSSNAFVDLPEGEHANWRGYSPLKWAASANHVLGQSVTSSESFTWTHFAAFRSTPLDLKAEADVDFLEGSNQLIGHGWPYSPPSAGNPGWAFYAAGALNDHNPWWIVMPDVTRYMQRISYLLRQGSPVSDVALMLPTEDAWANSRAGALESSDTIAARVGDAVSAQILDAGMNFDYVDSGLINRMISSRVESGGLRYPVLVLPGIERMPVATYRAIEGYATGGGLVIALRRLPSRAPGFKTAAADTQEVQRISRELFQPGGPGHFLADPTQLSGLLRRLRTPDVTFSVPTQAVGFVHRRISSDTDLYFFANTGNRTVHTRAVFRMPGRLTGRRIEEWDPFSAAATQVGDGSSVALALEPYESKVVVLTEGQGPSMSQAQSAEAAVQLPAPLDLSRGWNVSFDSISHSATMQNLHSWTEDAATEFYSGQASYTKEFDLPAGYLEGFRKQGWELDLDFGPGSAVAPDSRMRDGMRAWLESPVREAALVSVNGSPAGSVWRPPYRVEIGRLLQPGRNRIEIIVGNLAINSLAGRASPDYRLLYSRYGQRFSPQNMNNLAPLPAGILGPVRIVARMPVAEAKAGR